MSDIAWQHEHSLETDASRSFAWSYMTDVRNWNDPPAAFTLDGPFATGSRGTTLMPGQEPLRWRISDVQPGESYTLETAFDGATLAFTWSFAPASAQTTRLSQRLVLAGRNAAAYAPLIERSFGANLQGGMERIAAAIAAAARVSENRL